MRSPTREAHRPAQMPEQLPLAARVVGARAPANERCEPSPGVRPAPVAACGRRPSNATRAGGPSWRLVRRRGLLTGRRVAPPCPSQRRRRSRSGRRPSRRLSARPRVPCPGGASGVVAASAVPPGAWVLTSAPARRTTAPPAPRCLRHLGFGGSATRTSARLRDCDRRPRGVAVASAARRPRVVGRGLGVCGEGDVGTDHVRMSGRHPRNRRTDHMFQLLTVSAYRLRPNGTQWSRVSRATCLIKPSGRRTTA